MTREFLGLRMRNIQDVVFIWTRTYGEIFKSALVYLKVILCNFEESLASIQILYSFENTTTLPRCLKSSFLNLVKSSADKPYIHHLQPKNFPSLGKRTIVTAIAILQKRFERLFVSADNHLQQQYSNDSNDE